MISFITKLGLAGGAVTGVVLVDTNNVNFNRTRGEKKIDKLADKTFETIEDIELFESAYGCFFTYIDAWSKKQLYSARGMFENIKGKGRSVNEILKGANLEKAKSTCKNQKGVVTLNNRGNQSYEWELKTYGWE